MASLNKAAWLHKVNTPLEVGDAPMPTAGPGELVIKNAAVAMNQVDNHMHDVGVFIQSYPAVFGCDVAGTVHEVGPEVTRFKVGDRVIGHTINLITSQPKDGAFQLYTVISASKAAILPPNIPFTEGVVLPTLIETAVCALSVTEAGFALPGVPIPTLGLPYPSLNPAPANKLVIVYGGSSGVGATTTQLAVAAGVTVIAITSAKNANFSKSCGAADVFDYKDAEFVDKLVDVIKTKYSKSEFVGIVDAIATDKTFPNDLAILEKLGGGHLACTHPPPAEGVPANVQAGMIFCVNDVVKPVFEGFVTEALESGKLKCLPSPTVVGKGLEKVQEALEKCNAGVSATKLVVEL
ncbi:putative quinone oxidoreductase [Apodospora peruviana]|uniref:Quinone oxidoreductase n=1 Tax=Apodospora peruviana TaxID=516989 RepID=A0AAE0I3P7_9PEZI|nr:putative quinone oxidoreductase [Apodospora peruviana]